MNQSCINISNFEKNQYHIGALIILLAEGQSDPISSTKLMKTNKCIFIFNHQHQPINKQVYFLTTRLSDVVKRLITNAKSNNKGEEVN